MDVVVVVIVVIVAAVLDVAVVAAAVAVAADDGVVLHVDALVLVLVLVVIAAAVVAAAYVARCTFLTYTLPSLNHFFYKCAHLSSGMLPFPFVFCYLPAALFPCSWVSLRRGAFF